mmetsp:Transcript_3492/g.12533  ORF Transcript_3492/g.12533 Transcript_3492/m.12533 type:complete len:233 (-) Transcript_3492:46-744(-)
MEGDFRHRPSRGLHGRLGRLLDLARGDWRAHDGCGRDCGAVRVRARAQGQHHRHHLCRARHVPARHVCVEAGGARERRCGCRHRQRHGQQFRQRLPRARPPVAPRRHLLQLRGRHGQPVLRPRHQPRLLRHDLRHLRLPRPLHPLHPARHLRRRARRQGSVVLRRVPRQPLAPLHHPLCAQQRRVRVRPQLDRVHHHLRRLRVRLQGGQLRRLPSPRLRPPLRATTLTKEKE